MPGERLSPGIATTYIVAVDIHQDLIQAIRGKFVVLDGPDGSGKSTQVRRLAGELSAAGLQVVTGRDPGGTAIGDRIRAVLLDHDLSAMDVHCEALLFMASRAQLVAEVIRPALAAGSTVLCDRFVSSTCAYQGAAGLDPMRALALAPFAIGETWPDVTLILSVDADAGMRRIEEMLRKRGDKSSQRDAMERRSLDFHRSVHASYLRLPQYYPAPMAVVDGNANEDTVFERIVSALSRTLGPSR